MSVVTERLQLLITSTGSQAAKGIREVGDETGPAGQKVGLLQGVLQKLGLEGQTAGQIVGKGLALGAAAGGVALAGLAVSGIQKFVDLTAQVRTYQRYLGGTAEDASRVAAAVRMVGLDAGAAQSGFGQLAKRIGEGKDTLAEWNVEVVRNKDGTVNMSKTLLEVGDRYRQIADPAQRAAFLTENFGKSGQNLAPLFSKSREELQHFYDTAAQHHEIFSQDQLDKGREYQLKIRELEQAFEGLAVEIGGAVLPIVGTLTDVLTTVIGVLDDVGNALGGVNIASVGAGAAIGAMVAGPWGALAGAGIGLISALSGASESFTDVGKAAQDASAKMDNLNASKAAAEFQKVAAHADEAGKIMHISALTAVNYFKKIADESPANAAKIIEGLKGQGVATGEYEAVLRKVVKAHTDEKAQADATKAANDALAGSTREGKNAIDAYTQALQDQAKAIDEVQNRLLGAPGALLNYRQAQQSLTDAQNAYNDAVSQYGPESAEAQAAALRLDQAHQQVASSTLALDAAQQALIDTVKNNPAAVDAEIAKLEESKRLHPEVAASIDPLIYQLLALKQKYDDVPPDKHTDINATDNASGVIAGVATGLNGLDGKRATVHIDVETLVTGLGVGALAAVGLATP